MRKERKERKMGKNYVIGRRRKKAKKGQEGKKKGGREGGKKNRGRKFRKDEGKEGRKQGTKEGERKEGREQLQKFLIDVFFYLFLEDHDLLSRDVQKWKDKPPVEISSAIERP